MLAVPRSILTSLEPRAADATGALDLGFSLGVLAASMLNELFFLGRNGRPDLVARLGPATIDVLSLAMHPGAAETLAKASSSRRLLREIMTYSEQHIDQPLDNVLLSTLFGISTRTLTRLFAAEGTTPMRWIWNRRLQLAHEAIRSGRFSSVTKVALQHGFADLAHFSRAFKQAFGHSPSTMRSQAAFGEDER